MDPLVPDGSMDFKKIMQHSVLRRLESKIIPLGMQNPNHCSFVYHGPKGSSRTFMDTNCANPTSVSNTAHFSSQGARQLWPGMASGVVDSPLLLLAPNPYCSILYAFWSSLLSVTGKQ